MKPELPVAPVVVSQDTCLAAYGVSARWYLDRANAGAFPTRRAGKQVLSLPSDFLAYLRTLPAGATRSDDSERLAPTTVEAAAAALGLRRVS